MSLQMEHLNNRMKTCLKDQARMKQDEKDLNTKMALEAQKHEHIYNFLNRQLQEKDDEIEVPAFDFERSPTLGPTPLGNNPSVPPCGMLTRP